MEVTSVNLGEKRQVEWRGELIETGIFKTSVEGPILLEYEDVKHDNVIDRRYHGGIDKACYLYSADHYTQWRQLYPELNLTPGYFGENVTIAGLNEAEIQIGDIFQLGAARVQVTQPRQPCFKLGIRFGTQEVLKHFLELPYPGVYLKVLEPGEVKAGDHFHLVERLHNTIGLLDIWSLLYSKKPNPDLLDFACEFQHLAEACRRSLLKRRR